MNINIFKLINKLSVVFWLDKVIKRFWNLFIVSFRSLWLLFILFILLF